MTTAQLDTKSCLHGDASPETVKIAAELIYGEFAELFDDNVSQIVDCVSIDKRTS